MKNVACAPDDNGGKRQSVKRGSGMCFGGAVWWHTRRFRTRVDTLASARVAYCALLILIPSVMFAVRLHGDARFFLMTLCTHDVIVKILCRFCIAV